MKILSISMYCIFGGVVAQLRHRLDAVGRQCEMHFAFMEDHGASSAFPDGTVLHMLPDMNALTRLVQKEQYDIIVIIDVPKAYAAVQSAKTQAKILTEVHTTYAHSLGWLWPLLSQPPMAALLTPSEYLKERLLYEFGFDGIRPVYAVPNAINTEIFHYIQSSRQPANPIFLWVGRLDMHKNYSDFLLIASRIRQKYPSAEFWVAGGYTALKDQLDKFMNQAFELQLFSNLNWIQKVDYTLMNRLYSAVADSRGAVISTSTNESFGMVVVEAMACRCPVISSSVGALPEIMDGELAECLFSFGDVGQASKLALRIHDDDAWRSRLQSINESRIKERYSLQQVGHQYKAVLEGLLAG